MKTLFLKLENALKDGLIYILISGFFTQVIGFLSSIFVIRYLPKNGYGNYVSANNIYSYFTVFVGMGFAAAILQYCSENRSEMEKNNIYCFTLKKGTIFNVLLFLVIVILALVKGRDSTMVGQYLLLMAPIPFFSYFSNYYQILLRIRNLNKEYAFVGMANAAIIFGINVVFSRLIGEVSLILSQYIANIVCTGLCIFYLKKTNNYTLSFSKAEKLEKGSRKSIERYALLVAITNFTSNMLTLIDITCLDILSDGSEILAGYKVASVIPTAMLFISSSVILYYYPKLVHLYSDDINKFLKEVKLISRMLFVINGVITLGLFVFAPLIIKLLFGQQYMESISIFRVLCLNYFIFSSYRKLYGNLIALIKKVKMNFINTTLSGILNIILNIILINKLGAIGAAIATIGVSLFTTGFSIIYFQIQIKKERGLRVKEI